MPFPVSPVNGQIALNNNTAYRYDSTRNAWIRTAGTLSNVGSLTLSGPITYNANAAIPKSYADSIAIVFGF